MYAVRQKAVLMQEKIKPILDRPLYPYFYGLSFLLFKSSAFLYSFQFLSVLPISILFVVLTNRMIAVLRNSAIAVTLIWISLFHVTGISQLLGFEYAYTPLGFYVIFYLFVILLVFICVLTSRKQSFLHRALFNRLANTFLLISALVFLSNGLLRTRDIQKENQVHLHTPGKNTITKQPDIVWILMDEYGSSASLKQQFGFTNPLDTLLQQRGYTLLHTVRTRFPNTLFSVNAIFNADDSIRPSSYYEGVYLLRHGSLVPTLESCGYRFVNLGFFDIAEHPMLADRSGYPYDYIQQLISGTLMGVLHREWKSRMSACDKYIQEVVQRLNDSVSVHPGKPRFIWAHLPVPHTPFCRNKEGVIQKDTAAGAYDSVYLKRKYIDYLQYGNAILIRLLNQYPELGNSIVIISGDHGPRYPFLTDKSLQSHPYAAVHFPIAFDTAGLHRLNYISQLPDFIIQQLQARNN